MVIKAKKRNPALFLLTQDSGSTAVLKASHAPQQKLASTNSKVYSQLSANLIIS